VDKARRSTLTPLLDTVTEAPARFTGPGSSTRSPERRISRVAALASNLPSNEVLPSVRICARRLAAGIATPTGDFARYRSNQTCGLRPAASRLAFPARLSNSMWADNFNLSQEFPAAAAS